MVSPAVVMNIADTTKKVDRARQLLYGFESQPISSTDKLRSWEIQIRLADLKDSSSAGCITCLLLKEVLTKVPNGHFDWDDPALYIEVIFCDKTVLRFSIVRDWDHYEEYAWDFGLPRRDLYRERDIEEYQVYTLPSKLLVCHFSKRNNGRLMLIRSISLTLPVAYGRLPHE